MALCVHTKAENIFLSPPFSRTAFFLPFFPFFFFLFRISSLPFFFFPFFSEMNVTRIFDTRARAGLIFEKYESRNCAPVYIQETRYTWIQPSVTQLSKYKVTFIDSVENLRTTV